MLVDIWREKQFKMLVANKKVFGWLLFMFFTQWFCVIFFNAAFVYVYDVGKLSLFHTNKQTNITLQTNKNKMKGDAIAMLSIYLSLWYFVVFCVFS